MADFLGALNSFFQKLQDIVVNGVDSVAHIDKRCLVVCWHNRIFLVWLTRVNQAKFVKKTLLKQIS